MIPDDARPTGAIAVRLSDEEAAAVVEAVGLAAARLLAQARALDLHPYGAMREEARVLAAAARKLDSLMASDVRGGLEIHARREPIFERHGP